MEESKYRVLRRAVLLCFVIWGLSQGDYVLSQNPASESKPEEAPKFSLSEFKGSGHVYSLYGKKYTLSDLRERFPMKVHELEAAMYSQITQMMTQHWLDLHFTQEAKSQNITADEARRKFEQSYSKVSEQEIAMYLKRIDADPNMQNKSYKEKRQMVTSYIANQRQSEAYQYLMFQGMSQNKMSAAFSAPKKPRLDVKILADDYVRYGPNPEDVKPFECSGDACPVTVIEYSEYQCPFCAQAVDVGREIMKKYQGKIRWVMRDFPLDFHPRARPAAIVAACASDQGKYWHAYHKLFENQQDLSDKNLVKVAKSIGVYNAQFKDCLAKPDKHEAKIDRDMKQAEAYGVSGTPAYVINGQFFSGVRNLAHFSQVIDVELKSAE